MGREDLLVKNAWKDVQKEEWKNGGEDGTA